MSLKPVDRACPVPDDFRKGGGPERPACRQGLSEKRFPKAAALTSHSRQTRRKSVRSLGLAGSVCLLIVVLTHVVRHGTFYPAWAGASQTARDIILICSALFPGWFCYWRPMCCSVGYQTDRCVTVN